MGGELHDSQTTLLSEDKICNHTRFVQKMADYLRMVRDNPEQAKTVGLAWFHDSCRTHFAANSAIFASTLGIKKNSVNRNFRDHGFRIALHDMQNHAEKLSLPDREKWRVREMTHELRTVIATASAFTKPATVTPPPDVIGNGAPKTSPSLESLADDPGYEFFFDDDYGV
jgi:hypothetical protein